MSLPSFEETNNPGYDEVFNNSDFYNPKPTPQPSNEIEESQNGLPSYEETIKPGYDEVFNSNKKKKKWW